MVATMSLLCALLFFHHFYFLSLHAIEFVALGFEDPRRPEIRSSQVNQLKKRSAPALKTEHTRVFLPSVLEIKYLYINPLKKQTGVL